MSDELRADAEEVMHYWRSDYYTPPDVKNNAVRLARAYLAEHPADSGEPVTEAWLRSVGFADSKVENATGWIIHHSGIELLICEGGKCHYDTSDLGYVCIESRRQLRALFEALDESIPSDVLTRAKRALENPTR